MQGQDDDCGVVNVRGTFQGTQHMEGLYSYSAGGGGSFSGNKR